MNVNSIMTREVTSCAPDTTLAQAARTMREIDAEVLPVVRDGKAVGVITIVMATKSPGETGSWSLPGSSS